MIKYTKRQLIEKKLIADFKKNFYKKLGYYPIISTEVIEKQNEIPILTLNELELYFNDCFQDMFKKTNILRNKGRYRVIIDIRVLFSHFARVMKYTYASIGDYLGGKHHTTILHYSVVFNNEMETNPAFRQKYNKILKYIKEKKNESSTMDGSNQMEHQPKSTLFPRLL